MPLLTPAGGPLGRAMVVFFHTVSECDCLRAATYSSEVKQQTRVTRLLLGTYSYSIPPLSIQQSLSLTQSPLQVACPPLQHSPTLPALDQRIAPRIASVTPFCPVPRRDPSSLYCPGIRPRPPTPTHHGLRIVSRPACLLAEAYAGPPSRPRRC
jgi:hypothetical protein